MWRTQRTEIEYVMMAFQFSRTWYKMEIYIIFMLLNFAIHRKKNKIGIIFSHAAVLPFSLTWITIIALGFEASHF